MAVNKKVKFFLRLGVQCTVVHHLRIQNANLMPKKKGKKKKKSSNLHDEAKKTKETSGK